MKRNKFSLSYHKLLSCNMGQLLPIGLTEVLPGDSFQQSTAALIRVSPLLAPVMHPVHVRIHHWFVPHRLVWEDWEAFITGGPDGMDDSAFPTIAMTFASGTPDTGNNQLGFLPDYMGIPPQINIDVSALPFRAYNLIYNEFYRDQDLSAERTISLESGVDTTTSIGQVPHISWEKDYFTSARPWTQKGPQINIPLNGPAYISGFGKVNANFINTPQAARESDGQTQNYAKWQGIGAAAPDGSAVFEGHTIGGSDYPNLRLDTDSVGIDVNDLRLAFAAQRFEEARARWGSRYTEYLRYLGVRSSDARLQRPEYLGGGKQTIQFSEVLQTAPSTDGDDSVGVGNLKGHGIGAVRSNRYRRFFEEHGYIITLMSVKPRTMYLQGVPRTWNRRTKESFWQKELEHIGQQEILNKELYATHSSPEGIFGWQDRYDEYRRTESTVAGEFRTTNLNYWHMARTFAAEPVLNESFVVSNPTDRIFAIPPATADTLWVMAHHSIQARRMLSASGNSFIY